MEFPPVFHGFSSTTAVVPVVDGVPDPSVMEISGTLSRGADDPSPMECSVLIRDTGAPFFSLHRDSEDPKCFFIRAKGQTEWAKGRSYGSMRMQGRKWTASVGGVGDSEGSFTLTICR
jgi:hypothetical protein